MEQKRKIRIGLIGCGGMGLNHLNSLKALHKEVEIGAICDTYRPNIEEAQKIGVDNIPQFDDYHELLKKTDIEAVIIATPTYTHKDIFIASLSRNKHVLLEKPLAPNVSDCVDMLTAAQKSSNIVQAGLELRFSYAMKKMKKLVQSGTIGKPAIGYFEEHRRPFLKKIDDWILDHKKSGGTLVEKNVHHFDWFNWLMASKIKSVYATGSQNGCYMNGKIPADARFSLSSQSNVIDNAWITVEYENGCHIGLSLCLFSIGSHRCWLIGDEGRIDANMSEEELVVYDFKGQKDFDKKYVSVEIHKCPMKPEYVNITPHRGKDHLELQYFVRAIRGEVPPCTPVEEAYLATMVGLAAEKSVQSGKIIDFKEFCTVPVNPEFKIPEFEEYDITSDNNINVWGHQ